MESLDRFLLAAVWLGTLGPPAVAWFYDVPLKPALLYSLVLAGALAAARRFLPYKRAGLFVSVIVLLLIIDVGDTVVREKTSGYYRMHRILQTQAADPERIVFYRCYNRAQSAMEFYFNRPLACSDDWQSIIADPRRQFIVTRRQIAEAKLPAAVLESPRRVIACDRRWVIIVKPKVR